MPAYNMDDLEKWHFELTEKACNDLLDLVLNGKKKATSGSLLGYQIEGEEIPKEGGMSVITDWDGNPRCVIRTTGVRVIPFKNVTFDTAKLEGEDETLESWREKHRAFFREEGKQMRYCFSEDMDIVFEEFEIVEIIRPDS